MDQRGTITGAYGRAIYEVCPPGTEVYLFGSTAAGTASPRSDIDLLVVLPGSPDLNAEASRLYRHLGVHKPFVDLVVTDRSRFLAWRDARNTVYYDAFHKGTRLERCDAYRPHAAG